VDIFKLGAALECAATDSFDVIVADDALEGEASAKRTRCDDFELIGESDTREGRAFKECETS